MSDFGAPKRRLHISQHSSGSNVNVDPNNLSSSNNLDRRLGITRRLASSWKALFFTAGIQLVVAAYLYFSSRKVFTGLRSGERDNNIVKVKDAGSPQTLVETNNNDDGDEETATPGWRNIPVFAGGIDAIAKPQDLWYGQFGQDIAVSSLLNNKTNGYFIDLASNHPTFLSSTYSLERKFNWTGLCIEPNSDHWWGLSQTRKCQLLGAVIGQNTAEIVNFRVKNIDGVGGHGGIIGQGMKNERAPASDSKSFVSISSHDLFRKMNVPHHIDYFSLDVEGAEEFIMMDFPWKDYHISLLSVETTSAGLQEVLIDNGFKMVARLGEDTLWAHESIKNELNPVQLSKYATSLRRNDPRM
mmetsp:Transcript_24363/g.37253  ORF Transcript_24363/g.37253 Transcript_24363/m.37253 type:complete len:356 (+) Transcript_24363:106-1173(+)